MKRFLVSFLPSLAAIIGAGLISHAAIVGTPPTPNGSFATIDQTWLLGLAGGQNQGFQSGIVAHAGGSQAAAFRLPVNVALLEIDTVANIGDSVALPACVPPFHFQIVNNGANAASVYARNGSSDIINNASVGTAFTIPANNSAIFNCIKSGLWFAVLVSSSGGGGSSSITAGVTPTSGIISGNVIGSNSNVVVDTGVAYSTIAILNSAVNFTSIGGTTPGTGFFSAINSSSIGATTPGTGVFTGLQATSIGNVTPGAGTFSTLQANSQLTAAASVKIATRTASSATDNISATTDYFVCAANGSGAATENLPGSPATGLTFLIKDCSGNAGTNHITITPAAGNIDGSATFVMSTNFQSIAVTYTGSQWSLN